MKNIFYLIIVFSLFSCNDNDKIVFSITKPINWIDYTEYYQDNKLKKQNLNLLLKEGIFKEELIASEDCRNHIMLVLSNLQLI